MSTLDRRTFLRRSGIAVAGGLALGGPFQALAAATAGAAPAAGRRKADAPDYGPLAPVRDQTTGLVLLQLPRGFEYLSFGWTGDVMDDGVRTPGLHDGMAAFRVGDRVHLVRNHEQGGSRPAFTGAAYDPMADGGTTTLVFDPDAGRLVESHASLSGTIRNCAGGPTPWGSWLTCEETTVEPATQAGLTKRHGYVFEVPCEGQGDPRPITGMGRFSHEAVAIDPTTGIAYLTEDAGTSSGLYRYVPDVPGDLHAGGVLQMLAIPGVVDTLRSPTGAAWPTTTWVTIDQPDPALPAEPRTSTQGRAKGGTAFARLEGIWEAGGTIWFASTSGGPAGQGQIFEHDLATGALRVLFASPSASVLNAPDNLCVSPRGGLVLCEDGTGREYVHGMTTDGQVFPFALNDVVLPASVAAARGYSGTDFTGSEWAGATFEPKQGSWLFVNVQSPGITFAITGPWRQGAL